LITRIQLYEPGVARGAIDHIAGHSGQ